jgi:hypothetical protein
LTAGEAEKTHPAAEGALQAALSGGIDGFGAAERRVLVDKGLSGACVLFVKQTRIIINVSMTLRTPQR